MHITRTHRCRGTQRCRWLVLRHWYVQHCCQFSAFYSLRHYYRHSQSIPSAMVSVRHYSLFTPMVYILLIFDNLNRKEKSRAAFHLCRLFRPEFVKLNPVPLSSDALSRFGKEDSEQHTKGTSKLVKLSTSEVKYRVCRNQRCNRPIA